MAASGQQRPQSQREPALHLSESRLADAQRLNDTLKEAPPIPGYQGFVRMSRHVCGQTHGESVRAARALGQQPGGRPPQPWAATPRSTHQLAGHVLLHGLGASIDLQETRRPSQCSPGIQAIMNAQARSARGVTQWTDRKPAPSPRELSWDPGPKPPGRVDPSVLGPAGEPSISPKLDRLRLYSYAKERCAAVRNEEWPSAIRR
mmetsp:Transcript_112939/g.324605  ORF Transcript_112939/g.324605 Transcript_112939/m.324605 type:complete len:204 (-) Transcript_112939:184-795(-)